MRIHAPLRRPRDAAPLIEAGADTLYCGVTSPGEPALNNRPNDPGFNLRDMDELRAAAVEVRKLGGKLSVAINARSVDIRRAVGLARDAGRLGVDELIVTSLALLRALQGEKLRCRIALSVMNPVFNSKALDFFRRLRVAKICLPRHLSLQEMASLCAGKGRMELEAFVMSGLCMNVEAYCGLPSCPGRRRPGRAEPCHYRWRSSPACPRLEAQLTSREWDCGLCAMHALRRMGMDSLKIEGRGDPLSERIAYVRAVRAMLDALRDPRLGRTAYERAAKRYFSRHAAPCRPEYCYY